MEHLTLGRFLRSFLLFIIVGASFAGHSAVASVSFSQPVVLQPGWNVVSTPRLVESHTFSPAPETLSNFSIFALDASRPSGWATMADLGQTEFTPLYGYFVQNKTAVPQTLTLNYRASTTPNERLFSRSFSAPGWYSIGVANPSYAVLQGAPVATSSNATNILSTFANAISFAVDFTDAQVNPDELALRDPWKAVSPGNFNTLKPLRDTKGYAVYVSGSTTATYAGFQSDTKPQCSDGIDNDGDGKIDIALDPGCFGESDPSESDPAHGSLGVSKYSGYPNQAVTVPKTAFKIGEFRIAPIGEGVFITDLIVGVGGSVPFGSVSDLFLTYGSTTTMVASSSAQILDFKILESVAQGAVLPVSIYSTLPASLSPGATTSAVLGVVGVGMTSGFPIEGSPLTTVGQTIAIASTSTSPTTGFITLSKYTAFANQSIVVPQTAVKIGEYRLQSGSVEDVNLSTFSLAFSGNFNIARVTDVYVTYGAQTTPVKASVASSSNTWSISHFLPKNTTLEIKVYATLAQPMASGDSLTSTFVVDGSVSSSGILITSGIPVAGQTSTVTTGSLSAALDASTPVTAITVSGSQPKVASFKFTPQYDSFTITELYASTTANGADVIGSLIWKDGATTIATTPFTGPYATTTGLSIAVSPTISSTKTIDAYLQLGSVGTPGAAPTGLNTQIALTGFKYRNSSGVEKIVTSSLVGSPPYVYKTKPTISNVALPSTTLVSGTQTIAKVTVTADSAGSIEWNKITFNIAKFGSTLAIGTTTFTLYDEANQATQLSTTVTTTGAWYAGSSGGTVTFVLDVPQGVSGSKTYVIKAVISGAVASNNVSTNILSGSSAVAVGDYATIAGGASSFVWSDLSTTPHALTSPDWISDYLIKNLPTDSQTLSK